MQIGRLENPGFGMSWPGDVCDITERDQQLYQAGALATLCPISL